MKTVAAIAALAFMLPTLAYAQPPVTVSKCIEVFNGLNAMDSGFDRIIKDEKGEHVVKTPFKLGELRFPMGMTMAALRPIVDATDKARMGLIGEIGGGKAIEPNTPELTKVTAEYQKVLDRPCGVTLPHISRKDFHVSDENPIPISILSLIEPMLVE
jgi:hypothetical protein